MTYYLTKTVTWFGERDIGEKNKITCLSQCVLSSKYKIQNLPQFLVIFSVKCFQSICIDLYNLFSATKWRMLKMFNPKTEWQSNAFHY